MSQERQASFGESSAPLPLDKLALLIHAESVAEHCGVSTNTVTDHVRKGLIDCVRVGKRGIRFRSSDLPKLREHFAKTRALTEAREESRELRKLQQQQKRERADQRDSGVGTRIDPAFKPTPEMIQWAIERGHSRDFVDRQTEKFVAYWMGEGRKKADWQAVWRSWIINIMQPKSQRDDEHGPVHAVRDLAQRFGRESAETSQRIEGIELALKHANGGIDAVIKSAQSDRDAHAQRMDHLTHKLSQLTDTVAALTSRGPLSKDDQKQMADFQSRAQGIESAHKTLMLALSSLEDDLAELKEHAAAHDRSRASHYNDIQKLREELGTVGKRLQRLESPR